MSSEDSEMIPPDGYRLAESNEPVVPDAMEWRWDKGRWSYVPYEQGRYHLQSGGSLAVPITREWICLQACAGVDDASLTPGCLQALLDAGGKARGEV